MISEELMPALQGIIPAWVVTTSDENVPNCTCVSQVYPVDEHHVALSNQFFSKTFRNLQTNPHAVVQVIHPADSVMWLLEIEHVRIESDGPLFDEMECNLPPSPRCRIWKMYSNCRAPMSSKCIRSPG